MGRRAGILIVVLSCGLFAFTPAPATAESPARAALYREWRAHSVDPAAMLRSDVTLYVPDRAGGVRRVTRALDDWLELFEGPTPDAPGFMNTTETVVGDIFHSYVNYRTGSALCYTARPSSRLPATPGFSIPGTTGPLFFVSGGQWYNIHSTGYFYGLHSAGTTNLGSNFDTAKGPGPSPIHLPIVHSVERIQDLEIDFAGQYATFTQGEACTLDDKCTAVGFFWGSGVAIFDTEMELPNL